MENKQSGNNILTVILMYLGLYFFGTFITAGFITILKSYDKALKNDDWFIIVMSISWTVYCFCKGYLECKKYKNFH